MLLASRDYAGAHRAFETAIAIEPRFADAHAGLGDTDAATGDWRGAASAYADAARYAPAGGSCTSNGRRPYGTADAQAKGEPARRRLGDGFEPGGPAVAEHFRRSRPDEPRAVALEIVARRAVRRGGLLAGRGCAADGDLDRLAHPGGEPSREPVVLEITRWQTIFLTVCGLAGWA